MDQSKGDETIMISRQEHAELKRRLFELEALKSLTDRLINIVDAEKAIRAFNSYLVDVVDFSSASYLIIGPEFSRGFLYLCYLHEEAGQEYAGAVHRELAEYIKANNTGAAADNFIRSNPVQIGREISPAARKRLGSRMIFPVKSGGKTVGAILLASSGRKLDNGRPGWLTEAMIVTLELFLSRLGAIIRTQHSWTESLVSSLSDGIIMFDSRMKVILVNDPARRFAGLKRSGQPLDRVYANFPGLDLQSRLVEMLISAKVVYLPDIAVGGRHYEIYCTPVKDNQEKVVAGAVIMHDITRLKEIDQMKTDFVYIASHQLRTPLTGIRWFTQLLKKDLSRQGKASRRQNECLKQIEASNKMMIRLVNDLLDLSRMETGQKFKIEPKRFDLARMVEQIRKDNIVAIKEKRIRLLVSLAPKELALNADEEKIRQAVHNLLNNAVKYSRPGGKVAIAASIAKGRARILVKDQGIGIPEEEQARIFEKFFRAGNAQTQAAAGTGLGLYLARSIAEAHGGSLDFTSKPGRGTVFCLTLPLIPA